jgi:hypothetical protein
MAQKQLEIDRESDPDNITHIGYSHIVEVRKKGKKIGIYTESRLTKKKRGVSLPLHVWNSLQEQLPVINLKIQFASGAAGLDLGSTYYPIPIFENGSGLYNDAWFQTFFNADGWQEGSPHVVGAVGNWENEGSVEAGSG